MEREKVREKSLKLWSLVFFKPKLKKYALQIGCFLQVGVKIAFKKNIAYEPP